MNFIDPQKAADSIQEVLNGVLKRILEEESEKASQRVKERIVSEAVGFSIHATRKIRHESHGQEIEITVRFDQP